MAATGLVTGARLSLQLACVTLAAFYADLEPQPELANAAPRMASRKYWRPRGDVELPRSTTVQGVFNATGSVGVQLLLDSAVVRADVTLSALLAMATAAFSPTITNPPTLQIIGKGYDYFT